MKTEAICDGDVGNFTRYVTPWHWPQGQFSGLGLEGPDLGLEGCGLGLV